ncbi:hypothetical protein GQ53DRAFT_870945 [Thozetella sp. PMI_491]|nr:hypothetical protein GQ53DRAFT_870945 [Thozetella sp. PMI_491]
MNNPIAKGSMHGTMALPRPRFDRELCSARARSLRRDGFVIVENAVNIYDVDKLREGILGNIENAKDPEVKDWHFLKGSIFSNPEVVEVLRAGMGADPVLCGIRCTPACQSDPPRAALYHIEFKEEMTGVEVAFFIRREEKQLQTLQLWPGSHRQTANEQFVEGAGGRIKPEVTEAAGDARALALLEGSMLITDMRIWTGGMSFRSRIRGRRANEDLTAVKVSLYFFPNWHKCPMTFPMDVLNKPLLNGWKDYADVSFKVCWSQKPVQPWTETGKVNFTEDASKTLARFTSTEEATTIKKSRHYCSPNQGRRDTSLAKKENDKRRGSGVRGVTTGSQAPSKSPRATITCSEVDYTEVSSTWQAISQEPSYADFLSFFCLDPNRLFTVSTTKQQVAIKLYGTNFMLKEHQLSTIWTILHWACLQELGFLYLTDVPEFGKTTIALGVASLAVTLSAMASDFDRKLKDSGHIVSSLDGQNGTSKCNSKLRKEFSHACVCETDLAVKLASCFPPGPTVYITDRDLIEEVAAEARRYLDSDLFDIEIQSGKQQIAAPGTPTNTTQKRHKIVISAYSEFKASAFPLTTPPGFVVVDEAHAAESILKEGQTFRQPFGPENAGRPAPVLIMSRTLIENSPRALTPLLRALQTPAWSADGNSMKGSQKLSDHAECWSTQAKKFILPWRGTKTLQGHPTLYRLPIIVRAIDCPLQPPHVRITKLLVDRVLGERIRMKPSSTTGKIQQGKPVLSITEVMQTANGARFLSDLHLAASFPGTAQAMIDCEDNRSLFSDKVVTAEIAGADYNVENTKLWSTMDEYTANAPKATRLLAIVNDMMMSRKDSGPHGKLQTERMLVLARSEMEALCIYYVLKHSAHKEARAVLACASLPPSKRAAMVSEFTTREASAPNILVGTLNVLGTGCNLTEASYVVMFSLPDTKKQATRGFGRIHRPGQKKECQHLYLWTSGNPASRLIRDMQEGELEEEENWEVFSTDPTAVTGTS